MNPSISLNVTLWNWIFEQTQWIFCHSISPVLLFVIWRCCAVWYRLLQWRHVGVMVSQFIGTTIAFFQQLVQANNKNKTPYYWHFLKGNHGLAVVHFTELAMRKAFPCHNVVMLIMTSPDGSIFRVTASLCGEFTGDRWIPLIKVSDAELWCFFDLRLNKWLSNQWRRRWFETPSRSLWRHCNVTSEFHTRFHLWALPRMRTYG